MFLESLEVVLEGLTSPRLTHEGKHFKYKNVPMELKPVQQPHPPIWYPSSNEGGATFAGERGYNFVTLGSRELAKKNIDAYRAALAKRGRPRRGESSVSGGAAIGVNRHIVIADTDGEAMRIAGPAYETYYASLSKLQRENTQGPNILLHTSGDVQHSIGIGASIVGSPAAVRAEVERQVQELGLNYMTCGFFFGTITAEHAGRSLELFAKEIMPAFAPV